MKVFLLTIYMLSSSPPVVTTVPSIATREACEALGQSIVDDARWANSANRYAFRCYEYDQAP